MNSQKNNFIGKTYLLLIVLVATTGSSCGSGVDIEKEQETIRRLDAGLLRDTQEKDLDGFLSVYAHDVSVFVPNSPIVRGREAIRPFWEKLYSNPGFDLHWDLIAVDVSRGGDLAYSAGTYKLTLENPEGELATEQGKFVALWKKEPGGEWKQIVDIWNSNE